MPTASDNANAVELGPTPARNRQELALMVCTYLENTCQPPPGVLRWQDYLTGDGANDRPVLEAVARGLDITVWELLARAEGRPAPIYESVPRVKVKRVSARYVRERSE